jgi:predicted RNase H-like HicB family nuclease
MNATDYPVMLTWSKEDKAYLVRVIDLPGCVADGKTKIEALNNAQLAIEEWLETAKEMGWTVPAPQDDASLEALALKNNSERVRHFQQEVQREVETALSRIVPEIVKQVVNQMPVASAGAYFRSQPQPVRSKRMAAAGKG